MDVIRFRNNHLIHIAHERTGTWSNSTTYSSSDSFGCIPKDTIIDSLLHSYITSTLPKVYFAPQGKELK